MSNPLTLLLLAFLVLFTVGCDHENDNPTATPENHSPEIINTSSGFTVISPGGLTTLVCRATDRDGDSLIYRWHAEAGHFPDGSHTSSVRWETPFDEGEYTVEVVVSDGKFTDRATVTISVSDTGSFGEADYAVGYDDLSMTMVWIPADSYMMGTLDTNQVKEMAEEQAAEEGIHPDSIDAYVTEYLNNYLVDNYIDMDAKINETPRHNVTFESGFWIGKYEVTQQLWEAVTDTNSSRFTGEQNPVDNVSWEDVIAFIDTLNNQNPDANWRLPTESEWEYACRAGNDTTRYPWGNDTLYSNVEYYAVCGDYNGVGSHSEVGSRCPNGWGIHDMLGNVWEWVEDKKHSNYNGAPDDGSAWLGRSAPQPHRMMRGGSWYDLPQQCRSAQRNNAAPGLRYQTVGFRLVRNGPTPIN